MPRKPSALRRFSGMAGSPLAHVNEPTHAAGAPKPAQVGPPNATRMRDMVLLHYCFSQLAGETKKEHCFCEERAERVGRDVAEQYVKDGLADWLIVKNARAKTGTSVFHRAIVMRSVVIDGERLFARPRESLFIDRTLTKSLKRCAEILRSIPPCSWAPKTSKTCLAPLTKATPT